jgi:SNF2 family DNA or RNA helicase
MEREMFTQIDRQDITALNAAARTMKCLQLANGAAYVDPIVSDDESPQAKKWVEVHDEKLQALESIVEEAAGAPILVAYQFKSDVARILRAFPKARVLDANPRTEDDWNAGKIDMLIAHPASCGHGLNLQDGGNILVYFGHWWDLEQRMQILERIGPVRQVQSGHKRPVFVYPIIARDTVDELVILRHDTKREVQDLLLEAMKRKSK